MPITFAYGTLSVTIRPSQYGDSVETEHIQARGRTQDGVLLVADRGVKIERHNLEFRGLSDADKADLQEFFGASGVNGSEQEFAYTDHDSNTWTARLLSDTLSWSEEYEGVWTLSMTLEVTPSP
jgi:hypothetical protein